MLFRRLLGLLRMGMSSSTPGLPQAGRECVFIRMDADDITFLQPVLLWSSAPSAAAEVTSTVQQLLFVVFNIIFKLSDRCALFNLPYFLSPS